MCVPYMSFIFMKIKKDIIEKIITHAKNGTPIEVCGYLASQNGVISRHYELTNVDQSEEHFTFDPKEVKRIQQTTKNLKAYIIIYWGTKAFSNDQLQLCYLDHAERNGDWLLLLKNTPHLTTGS